MHLTEEKWHLHKAEKEKKQRELPAQRVARHLLVLYKRDNYNGKYDKDVR